MKQDASRDIGDSHHQSVGHEFQLEAKKKFNSRVLWGEKRNLEYLVLLTASVYLRRDG